MREEHRRRRRAPWLLRKLGLIAVLVVALILADVLSPYIKTWVIGILPPPDLDTASVLISHKMEKAGELIAVKHTDEKELEGKRDIFGSYTVIRVKARYLYEIGLGIKLEDVQIGIGDGKLIVTVPDARMIYDSFQVTGDIQKDDFWGLLSEQMFQDMQDEERAACCQGYLDDPRFMEEAWNAACEQLETLFIQWTGEELPLEFVPESGES